MKYQNASSHEFINGRSDSGFCDECGFPAEMHGKPECDEITRYVSCGNSLGRIVQRNSDGKYFFELKEWMMGREWHPLTTGYQTGLFADAQDRFESWKRIQQRWEHKHISEHL